MGQDFITTRGIEVLIITTITLTGFQCDTTRGMDGASVLVMDHHMVGMAIPIGEEATTIGGLLIIGHLITDITDPDLLIQFITEDLV
jgi:hypothetical protein